VNAGQYAYICRLRDVLYVDELVKEQCNRSSDLAPLSIVLVLRDSTYTFLHKIGKTVCRIEAL